MKATTLGKHLTQVHKLTKLEYTSLYSDALITCQESSTRFKARGQNFAWLKRAKERSDDLTEYKAKMGASVRNAVMSNPSERKRRSEFAKETITKWATSDEGRKIASETAKKTSARPEILTARTEKLADWRSLHYDDFYNKCIKAMHSTWFSKPELHLYSILKSVTDYEFKHNQVIKSETFSNKSKRKQIDIADKSKRFYVEFDGIIHFDPRIKGEENFQRIHKNDIKLDEHITKHGWTLVRISYDEYSYKNGGSFSESCIEKLFELLKNPQPGVYKIGKAYETSI